MKRKLTAEEKLKTNEQQKIYKDVYDGGYAPWKKSRVQRPTDHPIDDLLERLGRNASDKEVVDILKEIVVGRDDIIRVIPINLEEDVTSMLNNYNTPYEIVQKNIRGGILIVMNKDDDWLLDKAIDIASGKINRQEGE